jgi:lysozyme family protein
MTNTSEEIFADIDRLEGGSNLDLDPRDGGNWTGGIVGVGSLRGTKHGIDAASNPHLDIASITYEQAYHIFMSKYWEPLRCKDMPPGLARLVADSGYNQGIYGAATTLQRVLGVTPDGVIGEHETLPAIQAANLDNLLRSYAVARALRYSKTAGYIIYGEGWLNRLFYMYDKAKEK